MSVFDIEDLMDKVYDLLVDTDTGINYNIGLIEAEKATRDATKGMAGTTLKTVDLTNGIFYFWQDSIQNVSPLVVIYPSRHDTTDDDIDIITVNVELMFRDTSDKLTARNRVLRYSKALRRCLLRKRFSSVFDSAKISQLEYLALEDPKSAGKMAIYSAGIAITGSITNE